MSKGPHFDSTLGMVYDKTNRKINRKVIMPVVTARSQKTKITTILAQKELERRTEQYYRTLSECERKEGKQWSKIVARSAKRLWDK